MNEVTIINWRVSILWRSAIELALKPLNLIHSQFVTLASLVWLTKDGSTVSQIDVSKMTGLDRNTMSQIIRGLETKKFIKRAHSVNERSKNPTITPLGAGVLGKALPAVEQADTHFFAKLKSNEVGNIVHLFQTLKK